ncbi:UDP-2,4-diacetamido-2,4,6-trideoxy-beta-L-altropyranose hydrolase [Bacteroides caecigallinarum]|nr:UDP-2,4-diacetamido-2,4,6-trideoxy-beta-L-altropyranose hydrolase [Bacteroides caecigallinarum]
MTKRKVYLRADASAEIGYGHFIRSLALADMLKDDFDCTFFTISPSNYQMAEMNKVCNFVSLKEETKFKDFINLLSGNEIVVLDNYFFTTEYQREIKNKGCSLVCVDDMHDKHYVADIVINHVLTDEKLFSVESYTKLALGLNYALLRKPFLQPLYNNKEKGHWFVSFGGTDYDNMTAKFVELLNSSPKIKSITVVVGDSYKYHDTLEQFNKIEIKKNLSANEMQQEMCRAQYAVLPSSSVCIEAIACGCKIASGFFVENQRHYADSFQSQRYVLPLGNLKDYHGNIFIKEIENFNFCEIGDFSTISNRYIKLFKTL